MKLKYHSRDIHSSVILSSPSSNCYHLYSAICTGTGTNAGDPVEANSLGEFFKRNAAPKQRYMGSVKTNIGHLESAAGVIGVIKVLLMMKVRLLKEISSLQLEKKKKKRNNVSP